MSEKFIQDIIVRWADLDPNGHVRHSVFYDWGAQCRVAFLEARGVGTRWLTEHGVGPVIFREECKFRRELHFGDHLTVDFEIAGLSEDGRKWRMRHQVARDGGDVAAVLELDGAWMSLTERRIISPPDVLATVFDSLPKTDDFETLTSSKAK